ncbi:MAG: rod shape-determining protein MreD [Pseudomonadota bacterium]
MRTLQHHGSWVIALSFVLAMMLTMVPLPEWARHLRPEWVTMVLIYWCMALPERVGVGVGWLAGLFLDVIHGNVLGQYALALALVAYLTLSLHQRLRIYPLPQQALVVLLLLLLQQLLVIWIKGFLGQSPESLLYWLPSLSSTLLWPWLFLILRDLRRHFRVS